MDPGEMPTYAPHYRILETRCLLYAGMFVVTNRPYTCQYEEHDLTNT